MSLLTGLQSYYKFDANSNDSLGVNNGTDSGVAYAGGKVNNAVVANPAGDYIRFSNAAFDNTGNFSCNLWMRNMSNTGFNMIFINDGKSGTSAGQWRIYLNSSNFPTFAVLQSDATSATVTSTVACTTATWHMYTFVRNGTNILLYVDGNSTPDASAAWSNPQRSVSNTYASLFAAQNAVGSFVDFQTTGEVDEFGTWSRVLSTAEISALYNGGSGTQYPFPGTDTGGGFLFNFISH